MLRPCAAQPCSELVEKGRCAKHRQELDADRGTTVQRGYDAAWKRIRAAKLARDPFCEIRTNCDGAIATEVDHREPIAQRPDLRLEWSNLQSSCKSCNAAKAKRAKRRSKSR